MVRSSPTDCRSRQRGRRRGRSTSRQRERVERDLPRVDAEQREVVRVVGADHLCRHVAATAAETTVTLRAPSTTWAFVRMSPRRSSTKPEPVATPRSRPNGEFVVIPTTGRRRRRARPWRRCRAYRARRRAGRTTRVRSTLGCRGHPSRSARSRTTRSRAPPRSAPRPAADTGARVGIGSSRECLLSLDRVRRAALSAPRSR